MSETPVKWTAAGLTPEGNALQAALLGTGDGLTFTRAVAADAEGVERLDLTLQAPCMVDGPKCRVPVLLTNAGVETGFTMTELRFYVRRVTDGAPTGEEVLYATVTDETGDPIPTAAQSPGFTIDWAFVFQFGNAGAVTVTLDPVGLVSIGMVGQPNGVAWLDENGAVPIPQGGTGATTVQGVVDAFGIFLAISAAAAYDPEGSYAVGDYCTHGGKLHKCNTPIDGGETWNAAHWTETTVAKELSNKLGLISGTYADLSAMPERPLIYLTPASGVVGLPDEWPQSRHDLVRLWCGNLAYTLDFLASYANKKLAYRMGQTQKWQVLVTETPPETVSIPLNSGFTGTLRAERNQFGQVLLTGAVAAESINANDLIATLPAGYLPKEKAERFSMVSNRGNDGNSFATIGQMGSEGDMRLWQYIPNNYAANTYLVINHNYQART